MKKISNVKRVFVVIMSAAMVMGSTLTAFAADGSGDTDPGKATSTSSTPTSTPTATPPASTPSAPTSNSSSSVTVESGNVVAANQAISVGGKTVSNGISGTFVAENVNGVAVVTPQAAAIESLGLTGNQKPFIQVYDFDKSKSNLAMNSINAAADALGASFVVAINANLGAKDGGKIIKLSDGSVSMVVGIPKTAIDPNKKYSIICVQPGGAVTILEDLDDDPNTVTFDVSAGMGTYAIVCQ